MTEMILAIDQGTTSSRAIVFDRRAQIVATAQEEFQQLYPRPGWVEHDPEAIWATTLSTARSAFQQAEAAGGHVAAIGITNQRETALLWDRKTLAPVGNAIVWQDRRTAPVCTRLKENGAEPSVQAKTGLVLDPYFSATKFAHLLDAVEDGREQAEAGKLACGTVDSFLLARLTGGAHVTDTTNASRTSLFDIHKLGWDDDLLALFRVPRAALPEVRGTQDDFGTALAEWFGRPLPIYAAIGDQQAAAIGQACHDPGAVKCTYGTGAFIIGQTGGTAVPSSNRLLTTISRTVNGQTTYALEGSIFVAGAAVQWLRDSLGVIQAADETQALAESCASTGGVYLVPAFAGLGAPHWAAEARGLLTGLTRGTGRAEIARAVLEAVVYQTADLLDAMDKDGAHVSALKVDGGMVANDWLLQFLTDILDVPVERPAILETTALGAAAMAGIKAGVYESLDAVDALRQIDRHFTASLAGEDRAALRAGWRKALAQALA